MTFKEASTAAHECVYKIICIPNGFSYIGCSMNFKNRIRCHYSNLKAGIHRSVRMQKDFNKYGECNFCIEIIKSDDENGDFRDLLELEKSIIRTTHNLYNINKIAAPSKIYLKRQENRLPYYVKHKNNISRLTGEEIKFARKYMGFGRDEFARLLGKSICTLSNIENNKIKFTLNDEVIFNKIINNPRHLKKLSHKIYIAKYIKSLKSQLSII